MSKQNKRTPSGAKSKARAAKLTLRDRLSRLTVYQATQLLGPNGTELIRQAGKALDVCLDTDVSLTADRFRARIRDPDLAQGAATVTLSLKPDRHKSLDLRCDACGLSCHHQAAALDTLLNEKLYFGLAAPPDEQVPLENLTMEELYERAMAERRVRATQERMHVRSMNSLRPWTDYSVTSRNSGKTYLVCMRGEELGQSYCSCPDFRVNRLGTCKHILNVLEKLRKRFTLRQRRAPYHRKTPSLRLKYGDEPGLLFNLPTKSDPELTKLIGPYATQSLVDAPAAVDVLTSVERAGYRVRLNPDAEEWLDRQLAQAHLRTITEEIRRDPANHPLRTQLLQTELLPYQLDGIAFCVGAGRAVLADDMGLGKTIQGIGIAELLAQQIGIQKVLIVCPATLKSQWISEIHRFGHRSCQIVTGRPDQRATQYQAETFFTVCNYEQVVRDLTAIQQTKWDLVLLDEGQRIKNWESLTSRAIRSLRSRFATVLTGTPVENRLDDLFTILQFVDEQRLGPAYQFFHRHRVIDENGRVKGYHRLDQLRTVLQPVVLRRTREQVLSQLPERIDQTVRIVPTDEQLEVHNGHMQTVRQITRKPYLTEMDILRLQKALLMSRMAANSTFLVNKQEPEYSSKLDHLRVLLGSLLAEPQRKLAVFSEWRTMLDRIEQILAPLQVRYVRLDGKVPQAQRTTIVHQFQRDEQCRLILLTNAGSTGLNLQSADTVINVDLPWNPAILEQRIGRAYRMGQKRCVQVYKLVTVDTIEERLLTALASKAELAQASLDSSSDVDSVASYGGIEELKRRLEILLGQTPPAPIDASLKRDIGQALGKPTGLPTELGAAPTGPSSRHRERVAEAGGQLLGAALQLVGELIQTSDRAPIAPQLVDQMTERLAQCVERDELNRPQLRISLPDDDSLRNLATTLARLLVTT